MSAERPPIVDAPDSVRSMVAEAMTLRRNILGGNERLDDETNDFDDLLDLVARIGRAV